MMVVASAVTRQWDPGVSSKRSLAEIVHAGGPLSVTDAVDVVLDLCDELSYAHANGVVHGSLALDRVTVHWPRRPSGRVEIFARAEQGDAEGVLPTRMGVLVPPEQRRGRGLDARADVWAAGAILHWLLVGSLPGPVVSETGLAHVPRALVRTMAACLQRDPSQRPQTIDTLAEMLSSFAASPAERFAQLAHRRSGDEMGQFPQSDIHEIATVLERLDDAALTREYDTRPSVRLAKRPLGELPPVAPPPSRKGTSPVTKMTAPRLESIDSALTQTATPRLHSIDSALTQTNGRRAEAIPSAITQTAAPRAEIYASSVTKTVTSRASDPGAPRVEAEASVASEPAPLSIEVAAEEAASSHRNETTRVDRPSRSAQRTTGRAWKVALCTIGALAAIGVGVGAGVRAAEYLLTAPAAAPASPAQLSADISAQAR